MKTNHLHRIFGRSVVALAALSAIAAAPAVSSAAVVAHWRFEEGSLGASVDHHPTDGGHPDYASVVIDSSGNGNHMRTWAGFTAPTYVDNLPFGTVPQTGQANGLALGFEPNQDIYTAGKPINTHIFTELTVEISFSANVTDAWQVIFGKDGHGLLPGEAPGGALHAAPPLMLKTMGGGGNTGHLELGLVDGSRQFRSIVSLEPLVAGGWYNVAATATDDILSLWMRGPGDSAYVLQGSVAISGAFTGPGDYNGDGFDRSWTIGRGMWNGGIADWFNGTVDEVRISDVALDPSNFLAVPEPSTYALLGGLGALALALFRRRNRASAPRTPDV